MSRSGPQVASFVREKHVERTERQFIGIFHICMYKMYLRIEGSSLL